MYATIEARANVLCAGIFISIAFIGKMLGGSLWGLLPLGFCVASGVFLWMKDLVRQGRDIEWSSEQKRGETAVVNLIPESVEWLNTAVGLIWSLINPDMFAGMCLSNLSPPPSPNPGLFKAFTTPNFFKYLTHVLKNDNLTMKK